MARYLVVAWDGAGNLMSTAAVAQSLSKRGHDVRLLGHRSIDRRLGAHGWRFQPFTHTLDFDATKAFDGDEEMRTLPGALWLNGAVGRDVMEELEREPADGLIVDCMLAAALSAGQVAGLPTVALFHTLYSVLQPGPAVNLLAPLLNTGRAGLGLGPVDGLADVYDGCRLCCIVATPTEFDVDMSLPPNVRFVGPMLAGPPLLASADHLEVGDATEPLVVVSFSTSYQAQVPALQRVVDALADLKVRVVVTTGPSVPTGAVRPRANTTVTGFVPHDRLLPYASLVISHGGLGTVMAALSQGVPLLCVPMGRDQFLNASRVEALGAGTMIGPDSHVDTIADAVRTLLDERSIARESAERMAAVISGYGGASEAADEIERVTRR